MSTSSPILAQKIKNRRLIVTFERLTAILHFYGIARHTRKENLRPPRTPTLIRRHSKGDCKRLPTFSINALLLNGVRTPISELGLPYLSGKLPPFFEQSLPFISGGYPKSYPILRVGNQSGNHINGVRTPKNASGYPVTQVTQFFTRT